MSPKLRVRITSVMRLYHPRTSLRLPSRPDFTRWSNKSLTVLIISRRVTGRPGRSTSSLIVLLSRPVLLALTALSLAYSIASAFSTFLVKEFTLLVATFPISPLVISTDTDRTTLFVSFQYFTYVLLKEVPSCAVSLNIISGLLIVSLTSVVAKALFTLIESVCRSSPNCLVIPSIVFLFVPKSTFPVSPNGSKTPCRNSCILSFIVSINSLWD